MNERMSAIRSKMGLCASTAKRSPLFTIFTDVQLFEVDQACDGGGQVGQVVVRHAELLQGLAVEQLLQKHRGNRDEIL